MSDAQAGRAVRLQRSRSLKKSGIRPHVGYRWSVDHSAKEDHGVFSRDCERYEYRTSTTGDGRLENNKQTYSDPNTTGDTA
jgi:hypothetical protein